MNDPAVTTFTEEELREGNSRLKILLLVMVVVFCAVAIGMLALLDLGDTAKYAILAIVAIDVIGLPFVYRYLDRHLERSISELTEEQGFRPR